MSKKKKSKDEEVGVVSVIWFNMVIMLIIVSFSIIFYNIYNGEDYSYQHHAPREVSNLCKKIAIEKEYNYFRSDGKEFQGENNYYFGCFLSNDKTNFGQNKIMIRFNKHTDEAFIHEMNSYKAINEDAKK